jgi:hypothetical protein
LAANPESGALIQGSGGLRKLRWSIAGRGKSGGVLRKIAREIDDGEDKA